MAVNLTETIRDALRVIPDYPKPGIKFQDITPVLQNGRLFRQVREELAAPFRDAGITHVVGIEARGVHSRSARRRDAWGGLHPTTKARETALEDRTPRVRVGVWDGLPRGPRRRVSSWRERLIVDDVLATGGTAAAAGALIRRLSGQVAGWSFLLAIRGLNGHTRLESERVHVVLDV